ncbi:DUF397 domain-containing protein [Streptomyces deccanensis]|uniref:DUF397 domain-containing protein n=1 Tax=Streptomyces deccanensis TaxID=424188 RepID=UPI001EFAB7A8|nr:DUF397 domain-containing protein [Streptomyces deccanensis]ULR51083.1 DUF397 domain-containing protein [Streptomyces deccanensis]
MPDAPRWQKSSFSGADAGDTCVELAPTPTSIRLRESDHPTAVLTTTPTPLHALLTTLKAGTLGRR